MKLELLNIETRQNEESGILEGAVHFGFANGWKDKMDIADWQNCGECVKVHLELHDGTVLDRYFTIDRDSIMGLGFVVESGLGDEILSAEGRAIRVRTEYCYLTVTDERYPEDNPLHMVGKFSFGWGHKDRIVCDSLNVTFQSK